MMTRVLVTDLHQNGVIILDNTTYKILGLGPIDERNSKMSFQIINLSGNVTQWKPDFTEEVEFMS